MRSVRTWIILALAAILLATPSQAAIENPSEPTPTSLYFHIFDTFNKFVVNTQPMDSDSFRVGGANFPTLVGTPVNQAYGIFNSMDPGADPIDFDFNTVYGYSTAGPVEYEFTENGRPRMHPERGIAAEVKLDTSYDSVAYIYGTLRDPSGNEFAPNMLVDYTVELTMREGDDPGRDAEYDSGDAILHGKQTFHIARGQPFEAMAGQEGPNGYPIIAPDANGVFELAIPISFDNDGIIPKDEAYNIRLDWYQLSNTPAMEDDQFAEGYLRLYADPEHLPRLDVAVTNPVYISFIHPQVAGGTLLIHTGMNSPWGTYDIDPSNITVSITGPTTPVNLEQVIAQNQHVHGLHDQDAEVTYLWKFRDESAPNGEYKIEFSVPNSAGNAVATATAGFTIEGKKAFGVDDKGEIVETDDVGGSKESPGVGFVGGLALLGIALLRRNSA